MHCATRADVCQGIAFRLDALADGRRVSLDLDAWSPRYRSGRCPDRRAAEARLGVTQGNAQLRETTTDVVSFAAHLSVRDACSSQYRAGRVQGPLRSSATSHLCQRHSLSRRRLQYTVHSRRGVLSHFDESIAKQRVDAVVRVGIYSRLGRRRASLALLIRRGGYCGG